MSGRNHIAFAVAIINEATTQTIQNLLVSKILCIGIVLFSS